MRKKSLAEMARIGKNENFSLPHNIKSHKQLLSNGKHCYIFKHDELGELGRILIVPHGQNSQICCEVAGDHDDPMTNKRREVFEPIAKEVSRIMSLSCGKSGDTPKTTHVITKDQVRQYERIREILDRIRMTFMTDISQEAIQRSAKRLEILQGDLTLLLNTEHEMNVFCEYCVFNYKMNGLNLVEYAYNKSYQKYKGEELEIFKKTKATNFKFLKLIEPIKENGVLAYDELSKENHKIIDKNLHKSFATNYKSGDRYYLLSHMIEFEDFIMTTGASVIVNIDKGAGELLYKRFGQYLNLISYTEPAKADTAQYITDMHKIALHEDIVQKTPSKLLPFGREALREKAKMSKNIHEDKLAKSQKDLILHIDSKVKYILANDGDDEKILVAFFEKMPEIMQLMKDVPQKELDTYLQKYDGFYHYIKLLENMAQGISDGTIKVPK